MNSIPGLLQGLFFHFEQLDLEYLVGGSFASGAWGQPRQTNDLDVALLLREDQVRPFVAAFAPEYMVSEAEIRRTLAEHDEYRSFQLLHREELFKIDAFVPPANEYFLSELERARDVEILPGVTCRCAAPENVIIRKLRWFELGNRVSDRQWNDIVQVLEVQKGKLDESYLDRWATHFNVHDLLNEARSQTFS